MGGNTDQDRAGRHRTLPVTPGVGEKPGRDRRSIINYARSTTYYCSRWKAESEAVSCSELWQPLKRRPNCFIP